MSTSISGVRTGVGDPEGDGRCLPTRKRMVMGEDKKKMTVEEWMMMASWEGGVVPAILDYGLGVDDLADDADPEFVSLLKEVESGLNAIAGSIDRLEGEWGEEM